MNLKTVTLTGADDTIDPYELFAISSDFPFVEWGILLSRKAKGQTRFPTAEWLTRLLAEKDKSLVPARFSAHLCGGYVREALNDNMKFVNEIGPSWVTLFARFQLNTHGQTHIYNVRAMEEMYSHSYTHEVIFQYDFTNTEMIVEAISVAFKTNAKMAILFDSSHGNGILPKKYMAPPPGVKTGYAGGLSAENILDQLAEIEQVAPHSDIWIDMESSLRSEDGYGKNFDLGKCREVLTKLQPFIK